VAASMMCSRRCARGIRRVGSAGAAVTQPLSVVLLPTHLFKHE
jgi:hypothetical protein